MHHKLRVRLKPSTLIATAALFAVTGGTAFAAGEIITSPDQIKDGVVTGPKLADNAITSTKLKNSSVTQDNQVNFHMRAKIASNGQVRGSQLDVVSSRRIQTGTYSVSFEGHNGKTLQDCAVVATPQLRFPSDPPISVKVGTSTDLVAVVETDAHRAGQAPRPIDANFDLVAAC